MRHLSKGVICRAALLLLLGLPFSAQGQGRVAFRIAEPDLIPEGIAYDRVEKVFYVGSTYKRKIVSVDGKGVVRDFTGEGQDGLWGLLGMKVDGKRRLLWAISSHAGGVVGHFQCRTRSGILTMCVVAQTVTPACGYLAA
jgi:hypothetical protein